MYLSVGVVVAAAGYREHHLPGEHSPGVQNLTDFQLGLALLQGCGGLAVLQGAQACRQQVTEWAPTPSLHESHCSFSSKLCVGKLPGTFWTYCSMPGYSCQADIFASVVLHE